LDNVAESLSWIFQTAPLPFAAAYCNILNMLYLACFPESTVHLLDAHQKIALAAVVDFLVSDEAYATLEAAILASSAYLQQCWDGRFASVPFKEILLDIYDYLTQVS
jgi:hypothetical protein